MANFKNIKQRYIEDPIAVLQQLVGQGRIEGSDYVAFNPRRKDSKLGSFRIDINSGRFHDFATGDRGGSIIDLAAFVYKCGIAEAAQRLENLFPFLASQSITTPKVLAKKKEIDIRYIWRKSTVTKHDYLKKKGILIGNGRVNHYKGQSSLIIPLTDFAPTTYDDSIIKSLQFINENGNKRFSGSFKGLFHVASDYERSKDIIVITEGFATARSIAESTNLYVIAAMSSINLKSVTEKISKQFPDSRIIIAADNDEAGRNATQGVSDISNVQIVYPTQGFNDFNDMYQALSAKEVSNIFYINEGEE